MNRFLLSALMSLALAAGAHAQGSFTNNSPTGGWTNNGVIANPQIDAVTFVNNGDFTVDTSLSGVPFKTLDTLNYINNGDLHGSLGVDFANYPSGSGPAAPAARIYNGVNGILQAEDTSAVTFLVGIPNVSLVTPSQISLWAIGITNRGQMIVGTYGYMDIAGLNVDLSRSSLQVLSAFDEAQGTVQPVETNYFLPDLAIVDLYWGQTNYAALPAGPALGIRSIWNGTNVIAPGYGSDSVLPSGSVPIAFSTNAPGFKAGWYINPLDVASITYTNRQQAQNTVDVVPNLNKGAVFVNANPVFLTQISFTPGFSNFNDMFVLMSTPTTNSATGRVTTNYISFVDTLASGIGSGTLRNLLSYTTSRPTNYMMSRSPETGIIRATNGLPDARFFISSGDMLTATNVIGVDVVTNFIIQTGQFSAYSATLDNIVNRPQITPNTSFQDLPGNIKIDAVNLNLDQARFRSEGVLDLHALHLQSSTNAVIDCENLSLDLGSTNGLLVLRNIAPSSVNRIRGTIYAWSATWSNVVDVVITNNWYFSNDTSNPTNPPGIFWTPLTNEFGAGFSVLVLDASGLTTTLGVQVRDLKAHARNIILQDDMSVVDSLLFDGTGVTLDADLLLTGASVIDWRYSNAPTVAFFTNRSELLVPNEAHFGDDRPLPYEWFVNSSNGIVFAGGLQLSTLNLFNSGILYAFSGAVEIQAQNATVNQGFIYSSGPTSLAGKSLAFNGATINSGDFLQFNETDSLSDGGVASKFTMQNGFRQQVKAANGDFLASTFFSVTTTNVPSPTAEHTWAGQDRGANPAGFTNNGAIGTLVLSNMTVIITNRSISGGVTNITVTTNSSPDPRFVFQPSLPGVTNALYVDLLDLTQLGQKGVAAIEIDPNFILYYAAVKVPTNMYLGTGAMGNPLSAAEYLNGNTSYHLNGNLRWVSSYAGANSSTVVFENSQLYHVNAALRSSMNIDSSGTGIPNGSNSAPFIFINASVSINGSGDVQPNLNGQSLIAGQQYSMIAQPKNGSAFLGWSGDFTGTAPQVVFTAPTNNVALTASFNFAPTNAAYSGLFYETNGVVFGHSGFISINTSKNGKFSGSLQIGSSKFSFNGQFDSGGYSTVTVPKSSITLALIAGSDQITGFVDGSGWQAVLVANQAVYSSKNPAPFAGKYTLILPGSGNAAITTQPYGDSYATINVDSSGKASLNASLADGVTVSENTSAAGSGLWPLYLPEPKNQGQVLGWLSFQSTGAQDVGGNFSWIRVENVTAKFYPDGFELNSAAIGSKYNSKLAPVTGTTNTGIVLGGGNLSAPIAFDVMVKSNNTAITPQGSKLSINAGNGTFSGSTQDPATHKQVQFKGAILQLQGFGSGFSLGTNQSARVVLGP
ncbi:MAG: hypothetical protein U1F98_10090 [Verrucomicrobiota bacterium]